MPAGEDRFSSRLLYPMHVLAVVAEGHRLGRRSVLDVTELVDEPLLRLNSTFASHSWFEAACQVAHIRPRVLLESVARVPHHQTALVMTDEWNRMRPDGISGEPELMRACGPPRHARLRNGRLSFSELACFTDAQSGSARRDVLDEAAGGHYNFCCCGAQCVICVARRLGLRMPEHLLRLDCR